VGVNTVLRGDGWNGPDTIDYSGSAAGVTVDLVSGVATGQGTDTVVVSQPQPELGHVVELLASTHEVLLAVLSTGGRARGVLDHARSRFVVRLAHRAPVRARVLDVDRVQMPHNPWRWTYLGTPGDDRVSCGAAYTARGRGGDDRCRAEDVRGCERS
jgi:hypothetical protein